MPDKVNIGTWKALGAYVGAYALGFLGLAGGAGAAVYIMANDVLGEGSTAASVAVFLIAAIVSPFWAFKGLLEEREWLRLEHARLAGRVPVVRERFLTYARRLRELSRKGGITWSTGADEYVDAVVRDLRDAFPAGYLADAISEYVSNLFDKDPPLPITAPVEGRVYVFVSPEVLGKLADRLAYIAETEAVSERLSPGFGGFKPLPKWDP